MTFFFNGRGEEPFSGEDRILIPSPKVATYDLQPEMSAFELTEAMLERIATHDDAFILVNFANPDMVGHTGVLEASTRAVEVTDECAGHLVSAVLAKGGAAIVTADHGNAEPHDQSRHRAATYLPHDQSGLAVCHFAGQSNRAATTGKLADGTDCAGADGTGATASDDWGKFNRGGRGKSATG